ncbi:hypothetical protein HDR66_01810 [bacterium]|nr:hypothetical protein [bacterium]
MTENKHYELHADYIVPVYNKIPGNDMANVELINTYNITENLRMSLWTVRAIPGRELESMRSAIVADQAKYEKAFKSSQGNEYLRFYKDSMIKLLKIMDNKSMWKNPEANIEQKAETSLQHAKYNANMAHAVYVECIMPRAHTK